jgi:hypothetical protein
MYSGISMGGMGSNCGQMGGANEFRAGVVPAEVQRLFSAHFFADYPAETQDLALDFNL